MAQVRFNPRSDDLRSDLRDVFQPDRGPQIRRLEPADCRASVASGQNQPAQRHRAVDLFRVGSSGCELLLEPTLFRTFTGGAWNDLLLLAYQALHSLHARVPWNFAQIGR